MRNVWKTWRMWRPRRKARTETLLAVLAALSAGAVVLVSRIVFSRRTSLPTYR